METITTKRYEACFELYLRYGGRNLSRIEREMRELGYADFNRRILYGRKEGGIYKPGWIERYEWQKMLSGVLSLESGAGKTVSTLKTPARISHTPPALALALAPAPDSRLPTLDFQAWLKSVSPDMTWDWKYQKYIYKHLQRVTDGTCKRLMIFLPPRHGKSELVTVRYAGWRLRQNPKMRVILASYNQKLADKFSRSVRKILSQEEDRLTAAAESSSTAETLRRGGGKIDLPRRLSVSAVNPPSAAPADAVHMQDPAAWPQCSAGPHAQSQIADQKSQIPPRLFPKTRTINTVSEWETAAGGGVKAVGVGAGVTGFGAQLVVIDDPVKSRAEAESGTFRDKLWDWYNNDLYTRLEPGASMILIQTRWHHDDLAGRLLNQMKDGGDQWEVINLPALSEPRAVATGFLSTAEPQRRGEEEANFGDEERSFIQMPAISDPSNILPLRLSVSAVNPSLDPLGRLPGQALCPDRYDETKLAEIQRQLGTYCFSALYHQSPTPSEGGIFKRSWFRKTVHVAPEGLKWKRGYDLAVSTKTSSCYTASFRIAYDVDGNMYIADGFRKRIEYPDQKRYVIGRVKAEQDTEHGIEKAIHGQALVQDLRRETRTYGKSLRGIDVTNDKVTRALKWAPLAEEGKVILVSGGWNREFLDEVCQFPGGQFDDQIDAVSLAVTMFDGKGRKMWAF